MLDKYIRTTVYSANSQTLKSDGSHGALGSNPLASEGTGQQLLYVLQWEVGVGQVLKALGAGDGSLPPQQQDDITDFNSAPASMARVDRQILRCLLQIDLGAADTSKRGRLVE